MSKNTSGRARLWRAFFRAGEDKPIRVRVQEPAVRTHREAAFQQPFRLGYGKRCDLDLGAGGGPEIVLELARARGPLRLSTPLKPQELQSHVNLSINGKPLNATAQDLTIGSELEVVDKASGRQYRLLVEPRKFWLLRPHMLGLLLLVLAVAGAAYGGYIYFALRGAAQDVSVVRQRVAASEAALVSALEELREAQSSSEHHIRDEFQRQLTSISEGARQDLSDLSEHDLQAREKLKAEVRVSIEALRQQTSTKTVEAYQRYKALEEERFESLAARLQSVELQGDLFKRVFEIARAGVLFIHTRYQVEFVKSGQATDFNSFGTGFLVTASGQGMTAQHVMFPWHYDRQFLILRELGLARVRPDSVRWTLWPTDERVIAPDEGAPAPVEGAYHSDSDERPVRFLFAPTLETTEELVSSPMGMVKVSVPLPGASDIAVFEVGAGERGLASLRLGESPGGIGTLDDVLAIGYPFSKLQDGTSIPQGVRGFVRRVGQEIIELDTAFHPGLSGAPILNKEGDVIGMASATYQSDVYGLAVHLAHLKSALAKSTK